MKTQADHFRYLPSRIVGIAVVLFSTAAIAAIIGLLPAAIHDARAVRLPENAPVTLPGMDTASAQAVSQQAPVKGKERSKIRCAECGLIVSMREIDRSDEYPAAATVALSIGTPTEATVNSTKRYNITVRMADGSTRMLTDASPASWRPGERVIVIAGTKLSNRRTNER